jgi:hypothetical protein
MKNGLEKAYEKVMGAGNTKPVNEANEEVVQEGELVKGQKIKPGQDVFDDYKEASGKQGKHKKESGEDVPVEAEAKLNPGYGDIKTEGANMLPESKFDTLFKKQLVEDIGDLEDSDDSPLETRDFDDDKGDFPSAEEDETGEEVDVATELRMVIDRLTEVAERLGAYDEEAEEAGEEVGEAGEAGEGEIDDELEESHVKLEPLADTVSKMTSRGNKKVVSALSNPGGKAKTTGEGGTQADGKLTAARKSTLGPGGTQKHPDVKGSASKTGASIFDNV